MASFKFMFTLPAGVHWLRRR